MAEHFSESSVKLFHLMACLPLEPCFCLPLIDSAYNYLCQFENMTYKICLHEHQQMRPELVLSNSFQF